MIKLGGNEKHVKYVKKTRKFNETRGKFQKVGGNNNFPEIGENVLFNYFILSQRLKKVISSLEILADENRKMLLGKSQIGKIFHGV